MTSIQHMPAENSLHAEANLGSQGRHTARQEVLAQVRRQPGTIAQVAERMGKKDNEISGRFGELAVRQLIKKVGVHSYVKGGKTYTADIWAAMEFEYTCPRCGRAFKASIECLWCKFTEPPTPATPTAQAAVGREHYLNEVTGHLGSAVRNLIWSGDRNSTELIVRIDAVIGDVNRLKHKT